MNPRPTHRPGYSLIELLVVLVLASTTLTIATVTLHRVYRAGQTLRRDLEQQRNMERLANQLRQDAHHAASVTSRKDPADARARVIVLELTEDRTIEYSLRAEGLDRTVKREGDVEHRDRFPIDTGNHGFWIVDASRERPLVALHVIDARSAAGSKTEHRMTVIQAAVGLNISQD